MKRSALVVILAAGICVGCGDHAPDEAPVSLSPNAPKDQPVDSRGRSQVAEQVEAVAPYIAKGRASYPAAKARYLAGLPEGLHFFAVTYLRDGSTTESAFVSVSGIKDGIISGRIATDLLAVKTFKSGDPYTFPESDVVDWVITHPDGSEEGNVVGKFLDEWQTTHPRG